MSRRRNQEGPRGALGAGPPPPLPPQNNNNNNNNNNSVKVEMGSNLTSEHDHSRPADILLPNWALGKPAAVDISVTSPLNPKIVSVAGLSAGAAALSTEERKHNENDPKCNALGWYCVPLVTESYGALGRKPWTRLRCLPPVLPSYRANQSQLCCLTCIAGSTCIW